ncbi:MAG: DNA helicase, partial [Clostridiales bacterium]|nr:DNA helicase [Clostridiales bacterium]
MDEKQASYFEALTAEALKSAEALESFRLRGVRESMVDKYSDQAHFIYELLQNADDANATSAHFELFKEELVFSHNGTRRFSVSNPATETEDQKSGMLGDINAITAVGSSSKPDEAAIGKFGLGFKAVFQYTTTPHIYDPDVFFKIERFIVPIRLNNDYPWRRRDETLFVFPFNHPARSAEDSYADISDKLRSLEYPLLFLSNLKEITFKIAGIMGSYRKSVEKRLNFADTSAELIKLVQNNDETDLTLRVDLLWLFTRHDKSGSKYCVGFFVDAGRLAPKKHRAFCFFPTKEVTGLNFIIHAPFLLTDSREGIKAGVKHNIEMIALLAQLAADCLLYLIDDDLCEKPMIDDGIFDIIPFDEQEFADLKSVNHISFKPFYNAIKKSFETHAVIPALGGYARMEDAYWTTPQIAKLFSNAQLALLSGNENARWVFTSFEPKAGLQRRGRVLTEYINSITTQRVQDSDIIAGHPGFPGISAPFIESQPPLWLHAFYAWIGESKARIDLALKRPILIDQHGKAKSVLDEKNHFSLFLPTDVTETGTGFDTVRKDFLDSDATLHFIKKQLGLAEPSLIDEINLIILRQYTEGIYLDIKQHFKKFFSYYEKSTRSEANRFVEEIREHGFILGHWAGDAQLYRGNAGELYFPSDLLLQWFMAKPAKFVSLEFYIALVGDDKKEDVSAFLKDLGVADTPRVLPRPLAPEEALLIQPYWPESTGGQPVWTENALDGCRELVHATALERSSALSKLVWNQLLALIVSGCFKDARNFLLGQYDYFVRGKPKSQPFESMDAKVLRSEPWLQNINGDFLPADRLTVLDLNPGYDTSSIAALELIRALGIKEKA